MYECYTLYFEHHFLNYLKIWMLYVQYMYFNTLLYILGDTVVLRRTELGFMDEEDSDERLRIILNSYIAHGSFKYKAARLLQKGSSFTQQDVNDGLIR